MVRTPTTPQQEFPLARRPAPRLCAADGLGFGAAWGLGRWVEVGQTDLSEGHGLGFGWLEFHAASLAQPRAIRT